MRNFAVKDRTVASSSRAIVGILIAAALTVALWAVVTPPALRADTAPPTGTPTTVSADPLPTVQVDGIVWKQAIHGNKVYATGRFATARPAGVPKGGAGTVTRRSLIAYDITTGKIDTHFVHSLTGGLGQGKGIAVSPDGTRLYVGGSFTTVDGHPHANFVAFDLTTNKVLSGFTGTNGKVNAVAATNTQAYIGGTFSTAGGRARTKLAAYNRSGSVNSNWVANVTGTNVAALAATKTQGNLVVGGSFKKINGTAYWSLGAVRLSTGASVLPWGSHSSTFPIRMQAPVGSSPSALGITSLSVSTTQVYLTAFVYLPGIKHPGSFEGRAAISATDGHLIWANDCAGDSYDAFPVGSRIYSVGHAHDCAPIGGFPQMPANRALAETTHATGVNGPGKGGNYPSFEGRPRGSLLNWFPVLNLGEFSGAHQAAWSVVATGSYVALAGEFTTANSKPQQGIVRYAVRSLAPNELGPMTYSGQFNFSGYAIAPTAANSAGESLVRVYTTGDPDNGLLTYSVYRLGSTVLLASKTVDSRFWRSTSWSFTDTGLAEGASALYRMVVKDPFGNTVSVADPTIIDDRDARIVYSKNGTVADWTLSASRPATTPDFARTLHFASRDGASYTYAFTGTSIKLIGGKGPTRGAVSVSIDGTPGVQASQNSPTRLFQRTIFSKAGLAPGEHTITVTKVPGSGTFVDIDGIVVR